MTVKPADTVKVTKTDLVQAVLLHSNVYLPRLPTDAIIDIVERLPEELQSAIEQGQDGELFGFYHAPTGKFFRHTEINLQSSQDLRNPPFEIEVTRKIYENALTYFDYFTP